MRRRGAGFCSTLNTLTKTCLELVVFNQEFSMVSLSRKRPLGVMPLLASIPRGQSQGSGHGYTLLPSETPALNKQHVHRPFFPTHKTHTKIQEVRSSPGRSRPSIDLCGSVVDLCSSLPPDTRFIKLWGHNTRGCDARFCGLELDPQQVGAAPREEGEPNRRVK